MQEREVVVFNTRDSKIQKLSTDAQTVQELEFIYEGTFQDLKLTTKSGLSLDFRDSQLPTENFVLFLSPVNSKAGGTIPVISDGGRDGYFRFRTYVHFEVGTNEEAAEYFRAREWHKMPWPALIDAVKTWNEGEEASRGRKLTFTEEDIAVLIVSVQAMNEYFVPEEVISLLQGVINKYAAEEIDFSEVETQRLEGLYAETVNAPRF